MHILSRLFVSLMMVFLGTSTLFAADSSTALKEALLAAIRAKDIQAASALVAWEQAPVAAHRMFKMSIADCFEPPHCKIALGTMTKEELNPQADYHYAVTPEGQLEITPPDGSGFLNLPYAKVNGQYRIILGEPTEESYVASKASADARKIAEELQPDLLTDGTALPADGGDPFKVYQEYMTALSKGDTQYLATSGTAGDRYFFGTAYKTNPTKASIALEIARLQNIGTPTLKGGFVKDNRAVLLIAGKNGQGWATEGAVILEQVSGKWAMEDMQVASYPPRG